MMLTDTVGPRPWLNRRRVVLATWGLAGVAALAPLVVTVALLDVAGVLFLLVGAIRLAYALPNERGPSRLAGLTAVGLGVMLLVVSGIGLWSLPVLFAVYLTTPPMAGGLQLHKVSSSTTRLRGPATPGTRPRTRMST